MSSEFFDGIKTDDAKGKANWSTDKGEEDASSRYAFLYYVVRPEIRADAGKENLHPKEFTSEIRTPDAIFPGESILCRRGPSPMKIDVIYRSGSVLFRNR